jgi:hypothetical protein
MPFCLSNEPFLLSVSFSLPISLYVCVFRTSFSVLKDRESAQKFFEKYYSEVSEPVPF